MQCPLDDHWKAIKRILRYLAGTTNYGLHFTKSPSLSITGFSDSDWAADLDDRRLTSGFYVYLGSNLISWCSKNQASVSRSSTEAEYRSLDITTSELLWITSLLTELRVFSFATPIVWVDNQSAISMAANPILHARTKHIKLDFHFIREKIASKCLCVQYVPSHDQTTDIFTKPLSHQFFSCLMHKLTITSMSLLEGC